jgi:hypothetical protein
MTIRLGGLRGQIAANPQLLRRRDDEQCKPRRRISTAQAALQEGIAMGAIEGEERRDLIGLTSMLWRVREALTQVLFTLAVEGMIVTSGQNRWLMMADRELDAALEQLRAFEVLRAIESDGVADRLNLPSGATLAQIAAAAEQPWTTILLEHREALGQLTDELASACEQNRRLLDSAAVSMRSTLESLTLSVAHHESTFTDPALLDVDTEVPVGVTR